MDGIIYGAFVGLGFGLFESAFYIDLARSVYPPPTHVQLFGQEAIRLLLYFLTGGLAAFGDLATGRHARQRHPACTA